MGATDVRHRTEPACGVCPLRDDGPTPVMGGASPRAKIGDGIRTRASGTTSPACCRQHFTGPLSTATPLRGPRRRNRIACGLPRGTEQQRVTAIGETPVQARRMARPLRPEVESADPGRTAPDGHARSACVPDVPGRSRRTLAARWTRDRPPAKHSRVFGSPAAQHYALVAEESLEPDLARSIGYAPGG
jgi:hypothetical protein